MDRATLEVPRIRLHVTVCSMLVLLHQGNCGRPVARGGCALPTVVEGTRIGRCCQSAGSHHITQAGLALVSSSSPEDWFSSAGMCAVPSPACPCIFHCPRSRREPLRLRFLFHLQSMKVKLQPPSGTELSPFNPIQPPAAITQVMLLANPAKVRGADHHGTGFILSSSATFGAS